MITSEILKSILPTISDQNVATFLGPLNTYMPQYGIDTPARIGGFLSQVGEESMDFRYMRELASGEEYEGRKDLGNIVPGDGVKYKGRGEIQITGETMYKVCSLALFKDTRLLDNPALLERPDVGTQASCWFWDKVKNINVICDLPENWIHPGPHQYNKTEWMTIEVNGGLNGYGVRFANYIRARRVLGF